VGANLYVFVSGPLTNGDPWANANAAIMASTKLLDAGIHPYCPHLSTLWATVTPREYEVWMALDLAWVARCDCLLRLPGKSSGADREVECARRNGVHVWHDVDNLIACHKRGDSLERLTR
jgi:hypothetical protein